MEEPYSWDDAELILDVITEDRPIGDSNVDRLQEYLNAAFAAGREAEQERQTQDAIKRRKRLGC